MDQRNGAVRRFSGCRDHVQTDRSAISSMLGHVIDIEHCGVCGATLRVIACIDTPEVIERILAHLATRATGAINDPRAPPLGVGAAQPRPAHH